MTAYYNEHDPKTAAWLRELIHENLIAPGEVDERSIEDVTPAELSGFAQCHFFAGIGGWSLALRLAGWPDDRPVWTGSCPCQPFSAAGKGNGLADERHLWPAWFHLVSQCRPVTVFGEQVASPDAGPWLDLVHDDLEALGYAFGALVLPAASVGAPHGRHRLFFVADARRIESGRGHRTARRLETTERSEPGQHDSACWPHGGVADAETAVRWSERTNDSGRRSSQETGGCGGAGILEHAGGAGLEGYAGHGDDSAEPRRIGADTARSIATTGGAGFWSELEWLPCRDGKARPVEPGTFPLAYGIPARVVRLRGYGNAIVPQVAAEVIRAYMG